MKILQIPDELMGELEKIATDNDVTTTDVVRTFFNLGLVLEEMKRLKLSVWVEETEGEFANLVIDYRREA